MSKNREKMAADVAFYDAVLREPALKGFLEEQDLYFWTVCGGGRRVLLQVRKHVWRLPYTLMKDRTLHVYFESRTHSELRLDAELYPCKSRIDNKPERKSALQPVLALKARILAELRTKVLTNDTEEIRELNPKDADQLQPGKSSTCLALKFVSNLPESMTPAEAADFYAKSIHAVTPIVDSVIAPYIAKPDGARERKAQGPC